MVVSRLRESRSELSGELIITHPKLTATTAGGHIFRGRFNLDSPTTRKTLASSLSTRAKADWFYYLELFCNAVLDLERKGSPVLRIGQMPPEVLVPPIVSPVLPGGGVTILFGAGGVGKSTIAAAIAVIAFTGESIIPGWKATNPCRPLILDYEDTPRTWNDRIGQLCRASGLAIPEIRYKNLKRPLVDEVEDLAAVVTEEGIGLVIVDSAGLAMGASSEYADAADGALRLFGALRELGVPALVIDHISGAEMKGSGPSSKPYGSIYKWNSARMVWEVKREKEPATDKSQLLLVNAKSNHGAKRAPIGLEITYGEGTISFTPADVDAPDLQDNLRMVDRMARLLLDGMHTDGYLASELDVKEPYIRVLLKRYPSRFCRPERGMIGLGRGDEDERV
jgi:hypothetical protein